MFSISRRAIARVSVVSILLSAVLLPGFAGRPAPAELSGSVASAQTGRSYDQFIVEAYQAVGRSPSCTQRQNEYQALVNAAAAGTLRQEAERFVSTLVETQASFDDLGGSYCQDSYYEVRNPANCDPFVNTRSDEFVTDLYHAFLNREPDADGLNYWVANTSMFGRKQTLRAFQASDEFGDVVNSLFDGGAPSCSPTGGGGTRTCGSRFEYKYLCP